METQGLQLQLVQLHVSRCIIDAAEGGERRCVRPTWIGSFLSSASIDSHPIDRSLQPAYKHITLHVRTVYLSRGTSGASWIDTAMGCCAQE